MVIIHRGVREEMNFICLSQDGVTLHVNCNIAVEMSQSTLKKDSNMRQMNKVHLIAMSNTFVFSSVKHF